MGLGAAPAKGLLGPWVPRSRARRRETAAKITAAEPFLARLLAAAQRETLP